MSFSELPRLVPSPPGQAPKIQPSTGSFLPFLAASSPHGPARSGIGAESAYIKPLDGLRCLAVTLVVWQHCHSLVPFGNEGVGIYGVWLFYALSGFLITGILLRERDRMSSRSLTLRRALGTFYTRRVLRIFPAYYLLLLVLGVTALLPGFAQDIAWYGTYLSNWMMAARGAYPPATGHLWSLAVEEQFYLVWPLLLLLLPRRQLPRLLVGAIVLAVIARSLIQLVIANAVTVATPTISNLDSLGIGALLAWHGHAHPGRSDSRARMLRFALAAGVALILVNLYLSFFVQRGWRIFNVTEALSAALVSVWLINHAALPEAGIAREVLSWRPIAYVGKISYGLYLYHFPLIYAFRNSETLGWVSLRIGATEGFAFFVVVALTSLAIAALSWRFFERPMNSLKRHFPYS
jgi:peptidoglycan/LPS O-acetylase OafA/YrhL